jgi:hypothetical protein
MSKLKAKDPKSTEPRKPQLVLFGASGVGKTWFALSFPNVYYIDTEGGAQRSHYMERLAGSGGRYLGPDDGANDFDVIIEQTKALGTERHGFKTLVIDSVTKPFITAISTEGERLGSANAFGADKKPAISYMRRLITAVSRLDMNVIFVAHEKAEWGLDKDGNRAEIGKIPDAHEKLIYELDLALQVTKRGPARKAVVKKSRLQGFPEAEHFDLDYDLFAERYGKDIITKAVIPLALATPEQVTEINHLLSVLHPDKQGREFLQKCLDKANAETPAELNIEQATATITALRKKLT